MPFRFTLATVLRIRESVEKQEERALQKILVEMARVVRQIDELTAEIAKSRDAGEQAMRQPIPAGHMQMMISSTLAAVEMKKSLIQNLKTLEQQRDEQLKIYHAAHRNSETLIDLRHKQRDAHEQQQARSEQKKLDDIFIARRQRS
jgi:flagellar export protein FliJ